MKHSASWQSFARRTPAARNEVVPPYTAGDFLFLSVRVLAIHPLHKSLAENPDFIQNGGLGDFGFWVLDFGFLEAGLAILDL